MWDITTAIERASKSPGSYAKRSYVYFLFEQFKVSIVGDIPWFLKPK